MRPLSGSISPVEGQLERRLVGAALLATVIWILLLARLFYLQVLQAEKYRDSSQRNSVRTHRVAAPRGMILDRQGEILVDSRPSFDVRVVPHETPDLAATLDRLAGLVDQDAAELIDRVGAPQGRARFQPQRVANDLGRDTLARVEARLWALPGVLTEVSPIRAYRYGLEAGHVLGWLGQINAEQLASRAYQGYRRGDVVGTAGVERVLDRELRGRDGGENVLMDAHGRELELLDFVQPQPGNNVFLTLDRRLQYVAEQAFDALGKNGAVVALDPRTGEVLLLMSRPAVDPSRFAQGIGHDEWASLISDPGRPLHDRALQGQYPPGSTYKVVTALAGLESGVVADDYRVHCAGSYRLGRRRYRCWKGGGHGLVGLHRALVESCDVFFYKLGHDLGIQRLAYYAQALGVGQTTGIDLPGEAAGLRPTAAWKERRFGEPWLDGETLSLAIGQGFNLWTPLQAAVIYASIATGGGRPTPYVVARVEAPHGRVLRGQRAPQVERVAISAASFDIVRRALRGVVHEPHGTGYAMRRLPGGVEAAGKTGTAQVVALPKERPASDEEIPEAQRDHAWFVSYAPAESPRIVVAVLVEHAGHGGSVAAPIAREIVAEFLRNEGELHAGN